MRTITFYSYKGGAGRSLALANAAVYLARLGLKVVAMDFDLEAPGLHYKLSTDAEGKPLNIDLGIVDYVHSFLADGTLSLRVKELTIDVAVPGIDKPLVQLIPAGRIPSREYWAKLSRINWHDLFYSPGAQGVQVFLDLKNRIADELQPDFLLIDSRTGITEMGGVATTLLADEIICLVLPTNENLEGARAVLRSLKCSRRESDLPELRMRIAVSRLPEMKEPGQERKVTERILQVLNEEAEDLADTLSCTDIFVLHSEAALQVRESLRVGRGMSTDESVLLRDYLRLFADIVPKDLIAPKLSELIQHAKDTIWVDADAALKEVEELAESFGHPEAYRALLHFYGVRNVSGSQVLKRAQQLWEMTGDSGDVTVWRALGRSFEALPLWRRREQQWLPDLGFVEAVWRDAGRTEPDFGLKIAEAYSYDDREARAADVLLEVIRNHEPTADLVAQCIRFLSASGRGAEADALVQRFRPKFMDDARFLEAWAQRAIDSKRKEVASELVKDSAFNVLKTENPLIAMRLAMTSGSMEEVSGIADRVFRQLRERGFRSEREVRDLGEMSQLLGRWEEFESLARGQVPDELISDIRHVRRRRLA